MTNEVENVRCKETASECNCSLFVGLTHAGRSKTCVELGRETLKTTPTTIQFFSRED